MDHRDTTGSVTTAEDQDRLLSTSAVARKLGVAAKTVRETLLPVMVSRAGRRYYTMTSVRRQLEDGAA